MPSNKRIAAVVNVHWEAGQASMGKAGQALGPHGVNMVEVVVRTYNETTSKLPDLGTDDLEAAKRTIAGTARSMGIAIGG